MAQQMLSEGEPLLGSQQSSEDGNIYGHDDTPLQAQTRIQPTKTIIPEEYISRVLPIALTAAFAIAATSATTVFAYAHLICEDPAHCKPEEQSDYAEVVALATTVANVCGVIAVGPLQQLTNGRPKMGLFSWLIFRALSIAILAIGVSIESSYVAIAGRLFEGLATDNLLHYTFGAIYVRSADEARFSKLMGTSLALYMIGMSTSPTLVSLLPSFFTSFIFALAILGASLLYLFIWVPTVRLETNDHSNLSRDETAAPMTDTAQPSKSLYSPFAPFYHYYDEPKLLLPGCALFFYNTAQAYLFPAIMVHASVHFGFTSTQNGYLVSIAASVASVYLFSAIYAIPRLKQRIPSKDVNDGNYPQEEDDADGTKPKQKVENDHSIRDYFYAAVSMSIQLCVLPCFMTVTAAWEIYLLVVLFALGLSAPSFIKSYTVSGARNRDAAVTGLAVMESTGGLFSPMLLGTFQSRVGEESVFVVASCLVGMAMLSLVGALVIRRKP